MSRPPAASFTPLMTGRRAQVLEAVFRHSPIGKALVSTEGRFMAANPALSRMLGYTTDELQALTFQEITHPDDLETDLRLLQELGRGERDHYTIVKRYVRRDGQLVWAQLDVGMVAQEDAQPAFYIAQIQDVTERLEQERTLLALHDRLQLALNATQEGIWDWRPGSSGVQVSGPWRDLTGLSGEGDRASCHQWLRRIHPTDRPQLLSQVREHLRGTSPRLDLPYRHLQPDGSWRWLSLRGRVTQTHPDGTPARLTGTLSDIDERVRAQQDLQVLMDHLPAMIGYWDHNLHSRFGNRTYLDWFGKDARLMPGRHISEVLDARTYAQNRPMMEAVLAGQEQTFERKIVGPDGRVRHTRLQYVPDRRGDDVIGFFALGVDITGLREAERALSEQQELARVTLMSIGDSVITTDPKGVVTFLNPVAQRMTGWSLEQAIGQPVELVMPLLEESNDATPLLNPLRVALQEREVQGMASGAVLVSRDGATYSVEDSAAPILTEDGTLLGGVIVFHDVTEKRALAERMTYLAQHDPLTGLPNRTLLLDRVQHLLQINRRNSGTLGLVFLDLDGFKNVNDTLGHSAGDDLLRQVAQRLRGQLRASDTLSRLGGDEFVLLLPDPVGVRASEVVVQKLLATLRAPFRLGADEVRITGSFGVALSPQDGVSVEDLMRHADVAMYRAKAEGRNRACFFNARFEAEQQERHRLVQAVQQAIALEQFELAYQPKVNGTTGDMIGVEALLRWTLDGKPVPPNVFVPVAEEAGHMPALGTWVLRAACTQGRAWLDRGRPLRVAVNVSALQFREETFLDTVRSVLRATRFPAHLLELEVTEGVLMQDVERVHEVLAQLQAMGIHISIDDFGTGYSSLSYLHTLPLNTLKIDRSFVNGAAGSPQRDALLRSIINLGRSLQLELVAEGVETHEEREHLLGGGCVQMQGYLFSRPVPPAVIDELLGGQDR